MNTSHIKHICLAGLAALAIYSCSNDLEEGTPRVGETGLYLNPQIAGADMTTRAVGDTVSGVESLNENKLVSLDVFIGKNGDFSPLHKRFTGELTTTTGTIKIASQNWKTEFPETGYDIYVIANSTNSALADITNQTMLGQKTQTDDDIYVPHNSTTATDKKFLMYGKYTNWTPSDEEEDMITVELNRVAAKIEASFEFTDEMKTKYTIGNASWKVKNIEKTGTLLKDYEYPTVGDDDSGDTPLEALNSSTIVTYSYPVLWTENDDAPYLLINIPLTEKSTGTVKAQNWYQIPVRSIEDNDTKLERNHIYYVKAIIASEGSSTEKAEDEDLLLNYSVYDWTTDNVDVNASKNEYLLVSPTLVYMRNIDEDSSIKYYASGDIEIVNKQVYYYDENGKQQTYTDANLVTLTATPTTTGATNGTITVSSPIPDERHAGSGTSSNLSAGKFTIRFIRFRVRLKSDTDKYQDVLVKQYPLEYIQNIAGWYSTRTTDGWIDWQTDQSYHYTQKYYEDYNEKGSYYDYEDKTTYNTYWGSYNAKVYDSQKNKILAIKDVQYGSGKNSYYKASSYVDTSIGGSNNHMYVIQITRTSSEYIVSKPTMNSDGSSDDHVVSPAFMLASQLGSVNMAKNTEAHGKYAIKHCKTYKEVAKDDDGNITEYDGWRLPTKEEISVIINFQKSSSGAPITEVLAGSHYWTADGTAVSTGIGNDSFVFTRCVRDLTPEEVTKLDENKK